MNPHKRDWLWRTPLPVMWQRGAAFIKGRLRESELNRDVPCFFVLSTGRTGTRSLAALLTKSCDANVFHEPHPHLLALARLAYMTSYTQRDALEHTFLAARELQLRHAWSCQLTYGETSNYTTYLAPIIAEALPKAKFVHVMREPLSFVRSGVLRGWFSGHAEDSARWRPMASTMSPDEWASLEPFEKTAWLWRETNAFISSFGETVSAARFMALRTEDLFSAESQVAESLFDFLDLRKPTSGTIARCLRRRWNKSVGDAGVLSELPAGWQNRVTQIAAPTEHISQHAGQAP